MYVCMYVVPRAYDKSPKVRNQGGEKSVKIGSFSEPSFGLLGYGRVRPRQLHVEQPLRLELGVEAIGFCCPSLLQDLPEAATHARPTRAIG